MTAETSGASRILTINGGSSSVKLALFDAEKLDRPASGSVERIGQAGTERILRRSGAPESRAPIDARNVAQAADAILDAWAKEELLCGLSGIGHRIVQGGPHLLAHARVTEGLLEELRSHQPLDPEHLPGEIVLIEAMARRVPGVPQVACFDSAFHRDMPRV